MVNAEKHKQVKSFGGMMPIDDMERMQEIWIFMLHNVNENPQSVLDMLDNVYDELNQYYYGVTDKHYHILKIGTCQRILEIYEHAFVLKDAIQRFNEVLTVNQSVVKSILNTCNNIINAFKDIQSAQNKNISKTHHGMPGIKASKSCNNTNVSNDIFENVVRLETPISLKNDGG